MTVLCPTVPNFLALFFPLSHDLRNHCNEQKPAKNETQRFRDRFGLNRQQNVHNRHRRDDQIRDNDVHQNGASMSMGFALAFNHSSVAAVGVVSVIGNGESTLGLLTWMAVYLVVSPLSLVNSSFFIYNMQVRLTMLSNRTC